MWRISCLVRQAVATRVLKDVVPRGAHANPRRVPQKEEKKGPLKQRKQVLSKQDKHSQHEQCPEEEIQRICRGRHGGGHGDRGDERVEMEQEMERKEGM